MVLTFDQINKMQESVNKNRETIQKYLVSNLPVGVISHNIKILSHRNERLLSIINPKTK